MSQPKTMLVIITENILAETDSPKNYVILTIFYEKGIFLTNLQGLTRASISVASPSLRVPLHCPELNVKSAVAAHFLPVKYLIDFYKNILF